MEKKEFTIPKNIRQMGNFGDTYRIYVEDFVYSYLHQFLHRKKEENKPLAAVLLGTIQEKEDQQYVFISGAQKVPGALDPKTANQQEFWSGVYQEIKTWFSDWEILGWYLNLDGSELNVTPEIQQFFESTYSKGSRFLYFEDALEKTDAFFVQEQHKLQPLTGYAVYYEKNPLMQNYMVAEREKTIPKPLREARKTENTEEVVQHYRAIMNKLSEKPAKKKPQPALYIAGVAVLAIVAATGISQIGNYQNLKVLQQTLQTVSHSVRKEEPEDTLSASQNDISEERPADSVSEDNAGDQQPDSSEPQETPPETDSSESSDNTTDTAETEAEAEETNASAAERHPNYYIVQKGDSLVSISRAIYQRSDMVQRICELNHIEDMNKIIEGQKLLLPE